jgi:hypothetical protein
MGTIFIWVFAPQRKSDAWASVRPVVVRKQIVLAVEAAEGTERAIERGGK